MADLTAHDLLDTAEQSTRDAFALAHRAINAGAPAPVCILAAYDGTVTISFGAYRRSEARAVVAWMLATCSGVQTTYGAHEVSTHGYVELVGQAGVVGVKARVAIADVGIATECAVLAEGWRLVKEPDEEEATVA